MPVIRTTLNPKDFTVGDFKNICNSNDLSDDCTRFAFPEFLNLFNLFKSANDRDGAELVGKETIFAGVQVRVLSVPLINWQLIQTLISFPCVPCCRSRRPVQGADLLTMAKIGVDLAQGQTTELLKKLKKTNICASFTTPFGFNEKVANCVPSHLQRVLTYALIVPRRLSRVKWS